jgi:hypothetical protein
MHIIEILLALIMIICGAVAMILSAPDRPRNGTFWAGAGVVAGGICLLIITIPIHG